MQTIPAVACIHCWTVPGCRHSRRGYLRARLLARLRCHFAGRGDRNAPELGSIRRWACLSSRTLMAAKDACRDLARRGRGFGGSGRTRSQKGQFT